MDTEIAQTDPTSVVGKAIGWHATSIAARDNHCHVGIADHHEPGKLRCPR